MGFNTTLSNSGAHHKLSVVVFLVWRAFASA